MSSLCREQLFSQLNQQLQFFFELEVSTLLLLVEFDPPPPQQKKHITILYMLNLNEIFYRELDVQY